ncbi:hypothetical protein [Halomonas korlensis]|uniref:Uncharacterized protein n=1 Tax=Halomonas korlensis TaxID=463301 RepID=A0A1I7KGN6_9GAMM|nr:hypothetical protein [Halomonas korlensis]SFU96556.1 hypothetical protein SAMN04487955_1203 [Halomonas korlensis]
MNENTLFYFPYASFTDAQLPLLKVAALWFDKLVILDPVGASWDTVGADHVARDAVILLQDAGILEVVTPAAALARHAGAIVDAIRRDMADPEFLHMCEGHSYATGKQRWTLSFAKLPRGLKEDEAMRYLLGDLAREVSGTATNHSEGGAAEYYAYAQSGQAYDEYREGYDGAVEYRYADLPLALGESIMMNHALFTGLLHAGATPIADNPFHSQALALKLRRATQEPAIQQVVSDRVRARQLKTDELAATTLTDTQLTLPILSPIIPLEEVLEHRQRHAATLAQARDKLGWMARQIESEPWSADFANTLERKTIPAIARELDEARKALDTGLTERTKRLLAAAGISIGAASALLAVFAAPITPIALTTAGLGLASGTAIPAASWLLDWQKGKNSAQENGLHYLLKF